MEWLAGRADVVHGTNFVLPPLRRAAGVLTVHDLSYLRYPETVAAASLRYRTLVPRGLRRAAVVVTPSQAVAAEVRAEYGLGDRVLATPLGVDEGWFGATPMPAAELAARGLPERYLLFVGTVEPRKGLPALLSALRLLHDSDRWRTRTPRRWCWPDRPAGARRWRPRRCRPARCCPPATWTPPTCAGWWPARPCSRSRRCTRGSGCRRWRRSRPGCRWWPATCRWSVR